VNAIVTRYCYYYFVICIELEINKEAVGTSSRSLECSHQSDEKPVHGNSSKENEVNWKTRKIDFSPTLTMNTEGKFI